MLKARRMKRSMSALIIGNAAYPAGSELHNPVNDASDLGAKLKQYRFTTMIATDCTAEEMETKLDEFVASLASHQVGLFFFAGHGVQIDGRNYLLAINTKTDSATSVKYNSLPLDMVVEKMANSTVSTRIIMLDACRNNPWERRWHRDAIPRGLASVYAPEGTIIGFATSPGEVASDGQGRNGTYTSALLHHIDAPDCTIEAMFKKVRNTVAAATERKQTTWEHTSLSAEFYFNLSIGQVINDYEPDALADTRFIPTTKSAQATIAELKKRSWGYQNSAVQTINAQTVATMTNDDIFVLGRNIYQAACGSSNGAQFFIETFDRKTVDFSPSARKAILDGILFEIFFDAQGELRMDIKTTCFNKAFSLQRFKDLQSSFSFIAEALLAARADFYKLPGMGHNLTVTVKAEKIDEDFHVEEIYVDGINVLHVDDGDILSSPKVLKQVLFDIDGFIDKLGLQLVVPNDHLDVVFLPAEAQTSDTVYLPRSWSVRKR